MWILAAVLYGPVLLVSALNALLMPKPKASQSDERTFAILIPARDEAENLRRLLPALKLTGARVYVFDDESTDGTAQVAEELGAVVIRPDGPLPPEWRGKNRACHALALAATEDSHAEWFLFLDADVVPSDGFGAMIEGLIETEGKRTPVLTGFPRFLPGQGLEPLALAWMPWILLATNPFGLVSRFRIGHNGFTNGQITLWRTSTYTELWPHEQLKSAILEDIRIGGLLKSKGVRVGVFDLGDCLGVRMYQTAREALDGMSKNSFEIGRWPGTIALSLMFLAWATVWLIPPLWWGLGLLLLSVLCTLKISRMPVWLILLFPIACVIAVFVLIRSAVWHAKGKVEWKGRTYPGA